MTVFLCLKIFCVLPIMWYNIDLSGSLQTPTYSVLGVNPAPTYFTINQNNGVITLIRDLKTDPAKLQFYQVRQIITSSILSNSTFQMHINYLKIQKNQNTIQEQLACRSATDFIYLTIMYTCTCKSLPHALHSAFYNKEKIW